MNVHHIRWSSLTVLTSTIIHIFEEPIWWGWWWRLKRFIQQNKKYVFSNFENFSSVKSICDATCFPTLMCFQLDWWRRLDGYVEKPQFSVWGHPLIPSLLFTEFQTPLVLYFSDFSISYYITFLFSSDSPTPTKEDRINGCTLWYHLWTIRNIGSSTVLFLKHPSLSTQLKNVLRLGCKMM